VEKQVDTNYAPLWQLEQPCLIFFSKREIVRHTLRVDCTFSVVV